MSVLTRLRAWTDGEFLNLGPDCRNTGTNWHTYSEGVSTCASGRKERREASWPCSQRRQVTRPRRKDQLGSYQWSTASGRQQGTLKSGSGQKKQGGG
eukprot:8288765-Heterocapsa_arctica.AAC.1